MPSYSLSRLSDGALLRDLKALVARDRTTTAALLAHLAEVDARKLYLPAGYPSMFAYCVAALRLSEDAAAKRIQAARVARRFPALLTALAEGRLHLSGLVLLAPYLREDTAHELLAAATHRTKAEIEQLLAERFPRPDLLPWLAAFPPSPVTPSAGEHAPGHVEKLSPQGGADHGFPEVAQAPPVPQPAHRPYPGTGPYAPGHTGRGKVEPLGPGSFAVQFTIGPSAHQKLRYAQELLGHRVPRGDLAALFERALDALIPQLERQKFAATARPQGPRGRGRPRRGGRPSGNPRHIPAQVKHEVWERDQGQCTFVSESGQRCSARTDLEFDHIEPVARGGPSRAENLRLRCQAHNKTGFFPAWRSSDELGQAPGCTPCREEPVELNRGG